MAIYIAHVAGVYAIALVIQIVIFTGAFVLLASISKMKAAIVTSASAAKSGLIDLYMEEFTMTETVIIFICGMFAGVLMEFIISAVVIMKGDK